MIRLAVHLLPFIAAVTVRCVLLNAYQIGSLLFSARGGGDKDAKDAIDLKAASNGAGRGGTGRDGVEWGAARRGAAEIELGGAGDS